MKSNILKIGIVAKDKAEFESFVKVKCVTSNINDEFIFISNFQSTIGLNLDLVLLASESMGNLFNDCKCLARGRF